MVWKREQRAEAHPSPPGNMLGEQPLVHAGAVVRDCRLGAWTEIGPGWSLLETDFGDYSYAAGPTASSITRRSASSARSPAMSRSFPGTTRWTASRNTI